MRRFLDLADFERDEVLRRERDDPEDGDAIAKLDAKPLKSTGSAGVRCLCTGLRNDQKKRRQAN